MFASLKFGYSHILTPCETIHSSPRMSGERETLRQLLGERASCAFTAPLPETTFWRLLTGFSGFKAARRWYHVRIIPRTALAGLQNLETTGTTFENNIFFTGCHGCSQIPLVPPGASRKKSCKSCQKTVSSFPVPRSPLPEKSEKRRCNRLFSFFLLKRPREPF